MAAETTTTAALFSLILLILFYLFLSFVSSSLCAAFIGDIIIKEGTIGSKMYFIQEGIVDIVMANGEVRIFFIVIFMTMQKTMMTIYMTRIFIITTIIATATTVFVCLNTEVSCR